MDELDGCVMNKLAEIDSKYQELIDLCEGYIIRMQNLEKSDVGALDSIKRIRNIIIAKVKSLIKQFQSELEECYNINLSLPEKLFFLINQRMLLYVKEALIRHSEKSILTNEHQIILDKFKDKLPPNSTLRQDRDFN